MNAKKKFTCPFCSLFCNDLHFTFDGSRLVTFSPPCSLGEAGFRRAAASLPFKGTANSLIETSLRTARAWLREARQPLVVLSGHLDIAAVSSALRLAKYSSAILACDEDCTGSVLGLSMQAAGLLTATLGDLRNQSQVVLCGVNPACTHPRLGEFLGRDLGTASLLLDPPDTLEALRWLRLAGSDGAENIPARFAEPAVRIETASSGLVVFGSEWLNVGIPITTELLLWLKDLARQKRWFGLYLPPAPNSIGVVEAFMAQTGFPGNLRFGRNKVDYSPRLWRAEQIIQQGDMDLCILAGQPGSFSEKTLAFLSHARTILLDPDQPVWNPPVWLPTARIGVEVPGRFQRLDGVPVELQPVLPGHHPLIQDLLLELVHEEQPV